MNYELELWHSPAYGYTLIAKGRDNNSGYRLAGAKLWAGQHPAPVKLQTFIVRDDGLEALNAIWNL